MKSAWMNRAFRISVALLVTACGAGTRNAPMTEARGDTVDVSFRSGRSALHMYPHEGNLYLLGEEGLEYGICLRNRAPGRVEAVLSVDGRDAVSGRVADYRRDRGYVLEPREEICVRGFRESIDSVAAFTFTSVESSYAARMGSAENVGVIGIAVFDEVAPPNAPSVIAGNAPSPMESMQRGATESAVAEEADAEGGASVGTEYGRSVSSQAETVPFYRRDPERPLELRAVYYDNREGLEARGIRVDRRGDRAEPAPDPFPGSADGFAPPPPR